MNPYSHVDKLLSKCNFAPFKGFLYNLVSDQGAINSNSSPYKTQTTTYGLGEAKVHAEHKKEREYR